MAFLSHYAFLMIERMSARLETQSPMPKVSIDGVAVPPPRRFKDLS
jgi:hypothetical protein